MDIVSFNPKPVTPPGDLQTLCRQYLSHLARRGYSDNTVMAYRRDLEQFAGYLAGRDVVVVQFVATRHIDEFIDALLGGEGIQPRSAARKLQSVRGLFKFAVARGVVAAGANPADHAAPVRFEGRNRVAPEISRLLQMVDSIPDDKPIGIRDRAMFRMVLDSGLRVGGLLCLDLYDPDAPPAWCMRPNGIITYGAKGGRTEETVVSSAATLDAVNRWLRVRDRFDKHGSPALWLTQRGTRPSRANVLGRLKHHAKAAGMPSLYTHLLRHARISYVLERGDLHTAHYLAGHKQKSTTANIYGDQPKARLRERIRATAPLEEVTSC